MQAIKYLSRLRIKGISVPSNILLVSLNDTMIYHYNSKDYFNDIHKVYFGAASKGNDDFIAKDYVCKYNYSNEHDVIKVQQILQEKEYLPIQIDENCIVGWGERYYRENPAASKGDFIGDNTGKVKITGEIREPKHFLGLIQPYKGETNEKFKYLMDKLNDRLKKKDLGAFYTPIPYCEKAAELVRLAISRVPKGNDYVIIDRCAGTGNLQSVLTDEELSHCILSTYEYYEYKVLCERLADKVRFIIPPTENLIQYNQGLVMNADALSETYINNKSINEYINDDKCAVILFENPPYQDSSSITFTEGKKRAKTSRNESFIKKEYKKDISSTNEKRGSARDISNLFIWSAFKYYLRKPCDSYICFSPVKYFKSIGLVKKEFVKGFLFNRKFFHASASSISCILWGNIPENNSSWKLEVYDINKDNKVEYVKDILIKEVLSPIHKYNDKRKFHNDIKSTIVANPNGEERKGWVHKKYAVYNDNILGYMAVNGYSIDVKHRYLMRLPYYIGVQESFGFYLRSDNYISKLPLFCAKAYPQKVWYEKDVYFTSSDKGNAYIRDVDLLRSCLIYTCLCEENRCLSIKASDGVIYYNELCFDLNAKALRDLCAMTLTPQEKEIISIWERVLKEAKETINYNRQYKYGTYQIKKDLNTFSMDDNKRKTFNYPQLNGDLAVLKKRIREYYYNIIQPLLFKYELIK